MQSRFVHQYLICHDNKGGIVSNIVIYFLTNVLGQAAAEAEVMAAADAETVTEEDAVASTADPAASGFELAVDAEVDEALELGDGLGQLSQHRIERGEITILDEDAIGAGQNN